MTVCEYCKEQHDESYGSGRFCSSRCARGFSTSKKRTEINRKVSNSLKGRELKPAALANVRAAADRRRKHPYVKYCPHCEDIATHTTCCGDCHPWRGNLILFEKLGISTEGRKLSKCSEAAFDMLYDLYFNQKWSKPMITEQFGILSNTIYWFFKKHGTSLRSMSGASQNALLTHRSNLPTKQSLSYKQQWHSTWDGKRVFLRSSYELEFAKQLDKAQTPYEVEFKRIPYKHPDGSMKIAIPDFFLPLTNEIVEIKSSWTLNSDEMRAKKTKYLRMGYSFRLIVDKVEIQI